MKYLFFTIILFAISSSIIYSQTPGMIFEPATAPGNVVLDPNLNGWASSSLSGFILNDESESEIPFVPMVFPMSEPNSDLGPGPDCGFTDFVQQAIGVEDAGQYFFDASNNWIFRLRMGKALSNSKSYSILVDTDQKFGASGSNADPNYVTGNPGFEIEIVLATNFGVFIYNIDGSATTTLKRSYLGHTNYQKSIALSVECGDPDYFYDFFVPFGHLTTDFGITTSTPLRMVLIDNMAANKSSIEQTSSRSDLGGMDDCGGNFEACFSTIIDNYTPCAVGASCPDRSLCPDITEPIAKGATSISGTSAEANGTIIKVYKDGSLIGSTVVAAGVWTLSGIAPALSSGQVITATATATGEGESVDNCNPVTVAAKCTDPITSVTACNATKAIQGLGVDGAVIRVYYGASSTPLTPSSGYNFSGGIVTAGALPSTLSPATDNWLWRCVGAGQSNSCTAGGGPCLADGQYRLTQQSSGECESTPFYYCIGSAGTSTAPVITTSPILNTTTSVSGTCISVASPGNQIVLFANGEQIGTVTIISSTSWTISSLTLSFDQIITAKTNEGTKCISAASASVTVSRLSLPPVVTGVYCSTVPITTVSGTSTEPLGTVIQVYENGIAEGSSTTVGSNGVWVASTGISIAVGSTITAKATIIGGQLSIVSNSITVGNKTTNAVAITTPTITEGDASVSGTGTNGDVIRLYVDGNPITTGSLTWVVNVWTISGIASDELYTTGVITATATSAGKCESSPSASKTIVCILPSTTLTVDPVNTTVCSGSVVANAQVYSSQSGIIYQLFNGATASGASVLGTGGTVNLTSGILTSSTILNVKAIKMPVGTCTSTLTDNIPVTVNANPTLSLTVTATSPICSGTSTNVIVQSSQSGFSYQLRNDADNSNIGSTVAGTGGNINLPTGNLSSATTFNVLTTGPGPSSCSGELTTTPTVSITAFPTITSSTPGSRCGTGTVSLAATASAGTLNWYDAASGGTNIGTGSPISTPSISSTTTYYVDATNAGCTTTSRTAVVATVTSIPAAATASTTIQPTCAVATGTIVVTAPLGAYEFNIDGGAYQASTTFTGIAAGSHNILVRSTADNTCISAVTAVTVNAQPSAPAAATASTTIQPTCAVATGTIVVTAPLGAYEYNIDGGTYQASVTFAGIAAGSHNILVRNTADNTCISAVTAVTVNAQPSAPAAATASTTIQPTCALATGTIVVTAPLGAYEYNIDGGAYQASVTFAGIAAGSHNILVRNTADNTCISAVTAVTVNAQPSAPAAATASTTIQPTCALATGTIVVTAPLGAYEFNIDGGAYQASTTFAGIAAGSHNIFVRRTSDNTCISAVTAVTVNAQPSAPAAATASTTIQPTCAVATGTIVVTAPLGAYEFNIDGGAYQASATFAGIAAGSHNILVRRTSDNTCISTVTVVTVNAQPSAPAAATASTTIQPTCAVATGTIVVTAPLGAYEYNIDGGAYQASVTFAGIAAGSHNILVRRTSDNTCISAVTAVTVNAQPSAPAAATASTTIQPTCAVATGTIVVTAPLGAYEYNIDGGTYQASVTFAGIASGSHNILVRSSADITCISAVTAVTVNAQPSAPAAATASTTIQPTCAANGTIVVTDPIGAYEYNINGGVYQASVTFAGIAAGSHNILVRRTSDNTCISGVTVVPVVDLTSVGGVISGGTSVCTGTNSTLLTLSGQIGSVIKWQSSIDNWATPVDIGNVTTMLTATNLSATTKYRAVITSGSCASIYSADATIAVNALPVTSVIMGNTSPVCNATGITYNVTLTSGATYAWSVPVDATITSGATGSENNQITVNFGSTNGNVSVIETNSLNCTGAAVSLTISLSGCGMNADFSGIPLNICEGNNVTFTNISTGTTGATTYSWNFGSGASPATANTEGPHVITYNTSGLKTVTLIITDGLSSTETKTDYITVDPVSIGGTISGGASVCPGLNSTTFTLSGNTGSIIKWQYDDGGGWTDIANTTTTQIATNLIITTSYRAVVANGVCASVNSASATVTVNDNTAPIITSCAANQTIFVNAACQAAIPDLKSGMVVTDNCTVPGSLVITQSPVAGILVGIGNTIVTLTVADAAGNTEICTAIVTISDNTLPNITTCADNQTIYADAACQALIPDLTTGVIATDNCTTAGSLIITQSPVAGTIAAVGITTVTLSVADEPGNFTTCSASVNVISAPIANIDIVSISEDTPVIIDELLNDTDCDNNIDITSVITSCASCVTPDHGSITINPINGQITYTPDSNYSGNDTIIYQLCDLGTPVQCDTALIIITVNPVNDLPVVYDSTITIPEDSTITVCIPITDIDGSTPFTVSAASCFNHGTVTASIVGNTVCLNYVPTLNFNGNDSICVTVCDELGGCDDSKLIIHVIPKNDPPVAVDDVTTTNPGVLVTSNVILNDFDVDGDLLTVSIIGNPVNGMAVTNGNGTISYTPDVTFFIGTDTVTYQICDNGTPALCDTAILIIFVPFSNMPPVAGNDVLIIPEDQTDTIQVLLNDYDPNGNPLTVAIIGDPDNGTSVISGNEVIYTPALNYTGNDTIYYTICDNGAPSLCDTAMILITVTPVNDKPVINDTIILTPENVPVTVCIPFTDADGVTPYAVSLSCNANGNAATVINATDICVTYSPNQNYTGIDSICVVLCDADGACDTAIVHITVIPVNDPPVVNDTIISTPEDVPVTVCLPFIDVDGMTPYATTLSCITNGNATAAISATEICVTYTPNQNYAGIDSVCVLFCDAAGAYDTAIAHITVIPANDPPAVNDTIISTPEDVPVTVCLPFTDVDGVTPYAVSLSCNANGSVATVINATNICITYTPVNNFSGLDSICVVLCDAVGACDTAIVHLTVIAVNDPPVVNDTIITIPEDSTIIVCFPISDIDGPTPFTVSATSCFNHGTVSSAIIGNTVCLTYTPIADFSGNDSICVTVCDASGVCDDAVIIIHVMPKNDPPVAVNDVVTTDPGVLVTSNVLFNDFDIDGNSLTVTIIGDPANGIAVNNGDGTIGYTPDVSFLIGTDTITYQICDNGIPQLCDTAILVIFVPLTNLPPVATDDVSTITEDQTDTIQVLVNDYDPNGNPLTVTVLGGPDNGISTVIANEVIYTPSPNYNGNDTIYYTICDNGIPSLCDTAMIVITVTPVNDPPTLPIDTTIIIPVDTTITICIPFTDDGNGSFTATLSCFDNGTAIAAIVGNQVCITYTPYANFSGIDTVCVNVCDNGGLCTPIDIIINVLPPNDPPVISDTIVVTPHDSTITVCIPFTDSDGVAPYTATIGCADGGVASAVVVGNTACVTFDPNLTFAGNDTLCLTLCDAENECTTADVIIIVLPLGNPPVISDTLIVTPHDSTITVCIPFTDSDGMAPYTATVGCADGGVASAAIVGNTVCITYNPNAAFSGNDTVCVTLCDSINACTSVDIIITVLPSGINTPPVIADSTITIAQDSIVTICVPFTDTENNGPFTVVLGCTDNGTANAVVVGNTVCITYNPNSTFAGTDTICLALCDASFACSISNVYIIVKPPNTPPVIADSTITIMQDSTVTICVPFTDADNNGPFTVVLGCTDNGTANAVVVGNTVCITYDPTSTFTGTDTICLALCDAAFACSISNVFVIVTPPVSDPPVISDTIIVTPYDSTVTVCIPFSDTDGTGSYTATIGCADGGIASAVVVGNTVCVTFDPNSTFSGNDTLCLTLCDSSFACTTAEIIITVLPPNNPPVINDTIVTTLEAIPVSICLPFTDADGTAPYSATLGCYDNGAATAIVNGNQVCVTYTPNLNFSGTDTVCIMLCDSGGACTTSNVVITVTPVNEPPLIADTAITTPENIPITICTPFIDADGIAPYTVTLGCNDNGTVTAVVNGNLVCVTYAPNLNFIGVDTVCITLCDTGGACTTSNVVITVTPVNGVPVVRDTTTTTNINTPVYICMPFTDADGPAPYTATLSCLTNGTASVVIIGFTAYVTYTPNNNFVGTDTICITICDGVGGCVTGEIIVTVIQPAVVNDIKIPQGYSPNGDGVNDLFVIENLDRFPETGIEIFNRWGAMVFKKTPYANDWNGTSNGKMNVGGEELPVGTYFYILDLGDGAKARTGYVYLNR